MFPSYQVKYECGSQASFLCTPSIRITHSSIMWGNMYTQQLSVKGLVAVVMGTQYWTSNIWYLSIIRVMTLSMLSWGHYRNWQVKRPWRSPRCSVEASPSGLSVCNQSESCAQGSSVEAHKTSHKGDWSHGHNLDGDLHVQCWHLCVRANKNNKYGFKLFHNSAFLLVWFVKIQYSSLMMINSVNLYQNAPKPCKSKLLDIQICQTH